MFLFIWIIFKPTVWNFFCKLRSSMIIERLNGSFLRLSRCLFNSKNERTCQEHPEKLICPLSSRQVKYLKLDVDDACISFWSAGIFLCTPFLFIFAYSFVFRNRVFCGYIRWQCFLAHFWWGFTAISVLWTFFTVKTQIIFNGWPTTNMNTRSPLYSPATHLHVFCSVSVL